MDVEIEPVESRGLYNTMGSQSLSVIEADECFTDYGSLVTDRFRRVFNQIRLRDLEIKRLRTTLSNYGVNPDAK